MSIEVTNYSLLEDGDKDLEVMNGHSAGLMPKVDRNRHAKFST